MSLGTLTSMDKQAAVGPIFFDVINVAGDSAYVASQGGMAGLQEKLRLLRKDQRTIISVTDCTIGGPNLFVYNQVTNTFEIYVKSSGVERSSGDDSGNNYTLAIVSR